MYDNKRNTFNSVTKALVQILVVQKTTYNVYRFFQMVLNVSNSAGLNDSGDTLIYMAFAENPFVTSTSIPTTAR
jgi:hypothetical protein